MPQIISVNSRIRINDILIDTPANTTGSLYTRFTKHFQYLLNEAVGRESQQEFDTAYVPNTLIEDQLRLYLENLANIKGFFQGSTGIGKSTYIRKVFGVTSGPNILRYTPPAGELTSALIIPFQLETVSPGGVAVQRRVCAKLRTAVSICEAQFGTKVHVSEIVAYLKKTGREDLLHLDDAYDDIVSAAQRVKRLSQLFEYAYLATKIKVLAQNNAFDRIVVVVDNIENFPYAQQVELINECLSFVSCLNNNAAGRVIPNGLLISCRPSTRKRFDTEDSINSHLFENAEIYAPVALNKIIKNRLSSAVHKFGSQKITGGVVHDQTSWNEAYRALEWVISEISRKHGAHIVGIHNNNIRDALNGLTQILTNSHWYEEEVAREGAFKVQEHNYNLTEAKVMRALALRSNVVFRVRERSFPIANLLRNGPRSYTDFVSPMICKYFIKRGHFDRVIMVDRMELITKIKSCLGNDQATAFVDTALEYFLKRELLRAEDNDVVGLPRLYSTWRMMYRSSILLEFFRDDLYIGEDSTPSTIDNGVRNGLRGTATLRPELLFRSVADLVTQVAVAELRVLKHAKTIETLQQYYEEFGSFVFSRRMLSGLEASLDAYYKRVEPPRATTLGKRYAREAVKSIQNFVRINGINQE